MTLEEQIWGLKYNPFHADSQTQAQQIVTLFTSIYPDSPLCRTCRADIMKMYNILKAYQAPEIEMEKPLFKYRFASDTDSHQPFGSRIVYSNANLTDEIAEDLIKENPVLLKIFVVNEVDQIRPTEAAEKPKATAKKKGK